MSSQLLREDFIPMVAGYLMVLAALALGLRATLRPGKPVRRGIPGQAQAAPAGEAPAGEAPAAAPPQWRRLATRVAGTAVGGYLLLMLVVIGYYYFVARVGGAFIKSAFTGCAMLIGVAAPVFAALSWLSWRRQHPGPPHHPRHPRPEPAGPVPAPPES